MSQTIRNMLEARAWQARFGPQAPQVGDLAPDFELRDIHGENPVRLSAYRGRQPVALVFGSFT